MDGIRGCGSIFVRTEKEEEYNDDHSGDTLYDSIRTSIGYTDDAEHTDGNGSDAVWGDPLF